MVPGAGIEPARRFGARDFKSLVSTNFTTRARWSAEFIAVRILSPYEEFFTAYFKKIILLPITERRSPK